MTGRTARSALLLVALLFASTLAVNGASAAPPQPAAWETQTAEGAPTGLGFLEAGYLVLSTGNAGPDGLTADQPACAGGDGDADLFLITFPAGDGCVQAIDTSDTVGQEGTLAGVTAEAGNRAIVALPSAAFGASVTLKAYDLQDGSLQQAYQASTPGTVIDLASDRQGDVAAVTTERSTGYALAIYDAAGIRTDTVTLKGQPQDLSVSPNGRYVAVGGNFTQGNASYGYLTVVDRARPSGDNPVVQRDIQQAESGRVVSVAVADTGATAIGLSGGMVRHLPQATGQASFNEVRVGPGAATVATSQDGLLVLASSTGNLSRLDAREEGLTRNWTLRLNNSARQLAVAGPYLFVEAQGLAALDRTGTPLWQRAGGELTAISSSGRQMAFADRQDPGTPGGQVRAVVRAALAHTSATLDQANQGPTIGPGDIGLVNITVENTGAAILALTLEAETPQGITVEQAAEPVRILPGQTRTIPLTVQVGAQANAGPARIPLTAASTPAVNASTNLTFTVGTATDLTLRLQPGTEANRSVVQGQNTTLAYILENDGNADAQVTLEVLQFPDPGGNWRIRISPSSVLTVSRDSVTTILLQVRVPADATNGTINRIVVRAESQDGGVAASSTLTVNPFEALDLTPRLRTKLVAPGGTASFGYTLQNLGSIASNITVIGQAVDEQGTAYVPAGWSVVAEPNTVELAPGATRTIQVSVSAPADGQDGDRLRVQVLGQTPDGARASALAFTVIDTSQAPPPDEEPKREPLGLLAPLIGLGAAAATRRWTRDNKA